MAYVLIIAGYMVFVIWLTFTGEEVHPEDVGLPVYRQRILTRRRYRPPSYLVRWHIWAAYATFPAILIAIIILDT